MAGPVAQLSTDSGWLGMDSVFSDQNGPDVPLEHVDGLIRLRRARGHFLPDDLFADPAWDILLDLLRSEIAHQKVSVSSACIAASVPQTTGLRWLKALEQNGLVKREPDPLDARRTFVVLSEKASVAMRRYFIEVLGRPPSSGAVSRGSV